MTTSGNLLSPTSEHDILLENDEQNDTEDQDEDLIQREKYLSDKIISIESPNYERGRIPEVQEQTQAKCTNKKTKV